MPSEWMCTVLSSDLPVQVKLTIYEHFPLLCVCPELRERIGETLDLPDNCNSG